MRSKRCGILGKHAHSLLQPRTAIPEDPTHGEQTTTLPKSVQHGWSARRGGVEHGGRKCESRAGVLSFRRRAGLTHGFGVFLERDPGRAETGLPVNRAGRQPALPKNATAARGEAPANVGEHPVGWVGRSHAESCVATSSSAAYEGEVGWHVGHRSSSPRAILASRASAS